MPSSATLQTPSSPQIHNLPLGYFYSATLASFYSALDTHPVIDSYQRQHILLVRWLLSDVVVFIEHRVLMSIAEGVDG